MDGVKQQRFQLPSGLDGQLRDFVVAEVTHDGRDTTYTLVNADTLRFTHQEN